MSVAVRKQLVKSRARTWDGTNARTSITVHETANTKKGAHAAAHANLQSSGNVRQASWHYQVDEKEIVQSFPDTVRCWHAGRSAQNSIAIEICVNSDGDYNKALANAAALVRSLRTKYGLGRSAVKQHHNWTGKNCPSRLRASGEWSKFLASTDPDGKTKPPAPGGNSGQAAAGGGKSVAAMATEVIAGKHGDGHANRQKSLGISADLYAKVRAEVNRRAGASTPKPAPSKPTSSAGKVVGPGYDFPLPKGYYFGPKEQGVRSRSGYYPKTFNGKTDRQWLIEFGKQLERRGWSVGKGKTWLSRFGNNGFYGNEYRALIRKFQENMGIKVDSALGVETWNKAFKEPIK